MLFSYDVDRGVVVATAEFDDASGEYDHLYFGYALMVMCERLIEEGNREDVEALTSVMVSIARAGECSGTGAPIFDMSIEDVIRLMRALFVMVNLAMGKTEFDRLSSLVYEHIKSGVDEGE